MILVDTSVWVDHLRSGGGGLARLLAGGAVVAHPWVIGELALGNLRRRSEVLRLLRGLPQAVVASVGETLQLIETQALAGSGIGYVDAQLLASAKLTANTTLWTRERRLATVALQLGVAFNAPRG